MADAFTFKQNARLPERIITLSGNGLTNLDDVDEVKLIYRPNGDVDATGTEIVGSVEDSPTMKVRIAFGADDTATIGKYQWHIELTIGGLPMYFPEKGFYTFSITDNID